MLETSWEGHATVLANASSTEHFISVLGNIIKSARIDLAKPSRVVYARDTRPSGPALITALEDGIKAIGAEGRNAGVTTTPILHYLVKAINTKGTKDEYGVDSEGGYFRKMSTAFTKLVVSIRQTCHDVRTELNNLTEREGSSSTSHCRLCKWRRCKCGQQNIKISREQPTTHPPQRIHHYARSPQ